MTPIAFNARFHAQRPTGMQRYALELSQRFPAYLDPLKPGTALKGISGHLWEQVWLPRGVRGRLLWSPNNTGPLAVARQVCTIHDLIPIDCPEWFSGQFSRWYRWLMPRLAQQVRHIIAVSQFTKQRIVSLLGVPEHKISVIPNGVDSRFAPATPQQVDFARRQLGIASPNYLLTVGSLEPRKNLRRLLEAWRRVQADVLPDVDLVVAGGLGNERVFSAVSLEMIPPRVHFTGYVADELLPGLYSGASALLYPSLYEGFGLPPLEAMACGVPVMVANDTSLPEVVGDTAVFVNPTDEDSIADGILKVLSESGSGIFRNRCRERAAQFSWDNTARQTLEVLLQHCA